MSKKKLIVFNDTRRTKHFGCELVMHNLEKLFQDAGFELVAFWPVGKDWRNRLDELPASDADIDAVIVNGEGSMHNSATRLRVEALADIAEFSRQHWGVPSFLINATLHNNTTDIYNRLRHFKKIYVRDSSSLTELESFGQVGRVIPDLTLSHPYVGKVKYRKSVVGIDSVLPEISEKIKLVCAEHGWPFYRMKKNNRDEGRAYRIVEKIKNFGKSLVRSSRWPVTHRHFCELLSSKELVITGRYHAVTMCLMTRTPFIAIESNTPKISTLLNDVLGNNSRIIQLNTDINESVVSKYNSFSDDELSAINRFCSNANVCAKQMAEEIFLMSGRD